MDWKSLLIGIVLGSSENNSTNINNKNSKNCEIDSKTKSILDKFSNTHDYNYKKRYIWNEETRTFDLVGDRENINTSNVDESIFKKFFNKKNKK